MKKLLLFNLLALILLAADQAPCLLAQSLFKQSLYGIVLDAETTQPLESVNVYIARSSMGSATNEKGYFIIRDVPLGTYVLVIQMLGYEVQTKALRLKGPVKGHFIFKLNPTVIRLPEVVVSARAQEEWRQNFHKFCDLFLGTTHNASACEILNSQVLDFSTNHDGIFRATAAEPLHIVNNALGYNIQLLLEYFEYIPEQVTHLSALSSVNQTVVERPSLLRFSGLPRFEELDPEYEWQESVWRQNRLKAYNGSLRHFLATICRYDDYTRNPQQDTSQFHREESGYDGFLVYATPNPWTNDVLQNTQLTDFSTLLVPGELPLERKLSFDGYLDITFNRELEESRYRMDMNETRGIRKQRSLIQLNVDTLIIDTSGHFYNPFGIRTYGYWAWEKVAEMLPFDYHPPETPAGERQPHP